MYQFQVGIGQNGERQVQTLGRLALIGGALSRQAEDLTNTKPFELVEMVTEAARLRRAAARAGDRVPALRRWLPRYPGAGIDVDHGAAGELREINLRPVGRIERQRTKLDAREVARPAVVLRDRKIGGQHGWIVR